MTNIAYKGYSIRLAPLQLTESGEWSMELYIAKNKGYELAIRKFSAAETFVKKEDVILNCINFGKQIIDGEVENCTVSDL